MTAVGVVASARAQSNYDQLLDLYVRDGFVYYRALKQDRTKVDAYVAGLSTAAIEAAPKGEQLAFWLNAYNAIVLRTIIDHYPIPQRTAEYPPHSIRQIPGAFERLPHKVAGRTLTLDQIEQTVLPAFHDPGARPRRRRQRPPAKRGLHGLAARGAAERGGGGVRQPAGMRANRPRREHAERQRHFFLA